ncbi:MAG TPA: hypothetical protein VMA36_01315 [Candidatus Limnocylindria bacterium]|jgi:hypothetical protein|nr:hypothetical protein [Candidatus Limnocylindria bacterium]
MTGRRRFAAAVVVLLVAACTPGSMSASHVTSAASIDPLSNVASFHGCPVFTQGDYYNAPVTSAAVDPDSDAYIKALWSSGDTAGFYASTGVEQVNLATNLTPLLSVKPQVTFHPFAVRYPWADGFFIEPLSDHHAMVVQTQLCQLYEMYGATYSGTTLSAYSGAEWDLRTRFAPLPPGSPSAMASGLSLFAGTVRFEDYRAGSIDHALNWAPPAHTVAQYQFVAPASDTDQLPFKGGSDVLALPYGAHLRLKASFSTAGWGPQAQMVAHAMKTYGIFLADTGSARNALYFANASDGTNPWNASDLAVLTQVHVTDFEVLTLPHIQVVPRT